MGQTVVLIVALIVALIVVLIVVLIAILIAVLIAVLIEALEAFQASSWSHLEDTSRKLVLAVLTSLQ